MAGSGISSSIEAKASSRGVLGQEVSMIVRGGINLKHVHNPRIRRIIRLAKSKVGARYIYGAIGPHTFDCSGFTQYVYQRIGHIRLPRTAQAQYEASHHVRHAKLGELVFFGNSRHAISHVGICLNGHKMVDAQDNGVKIENIHAPWWHLQGFGKVMR